MNNDKKLKGYRNFQQTRSYGVPSGFTPPFYNPAIEVKSHGAGFVDNPNAFQAPPLNFSGQTAGENSEGSSISVVAESSRFGELNNLPFTIGTTAVIILPASSTRRLYLFVMNTHATNILYLQFGQQANVVAGVPLGANGGYFLFDAFAPQNDVWLIANGVGTTGILMYATKQI